MTRPADPPPPQPRHTRRHRAGAGRLILLASLVANGALVGWVVYATVIRKPTPLPPPTAGAGSTAPADAVEALGRVQPAGGVISVFGPPGDQVADLKVGLGAEVAKGQLLATLHGDEERTLTIAALDAQLKEAEALRKSIEKSRDAKLADLTVETAQASAAARDDIKAVDARVDGLEAQLGQARKEQARLLQVEAGGVAVSAQEKEQAGLLVTKAQLELTAAQAQKRKAEQQLATAPQTTDAKHKAIEAEADRAIAQVPYESVKAGKRAAEQKRADAAVVAPVAGRVVRVTARPGETLANQPVVQIADTHAMTVVAEVYETRVAQLREWLAKNPDHTLAVEVDARVVGGEGAKPLRGTVTADGIAPTIAKNTVFALGPREDADRRVVEVEVRLDDAGSAAVAGYIGLQVRTRFLPPK